jgi:hypothetical protein
MNFFFKNASLNHDISIIKKIKKLKIFVLSSFGHNGLDWTHSLLDGHPQILIMPAFSFYRSLNRLKLRKKVFNNLQNTDFKIICSELVEQFYTENIYKTQRRQFLFSKNDKIRFYKNLLLYSQLNNEKNLVKKLFFAIHFAFIKLRKIDIKNKKIIVVQEHVPWHSEEYFNLFKANFLFIMRDPRAAIGGSLLRFRNHFKKNLNSLQFDYILFYWHYSFYFIKKFFKNFNNSRIKIIKNEEMHINLTKSMKKVCDWMNIKFFSSCLRQTFLNKVWYGESSYLQKNNQEKDLNKYPPKDYYDPQKIEKRWKAVLTEKEILLIEVLLKDIFTSFNYKAINSINFFNKIKSLIFLFLFYMISSFSDFLAYPKNFFRRFLIIFFPNLTTKIFNSFR